MGRSAISFQTGPVDVHPAVRECLAAPFLSHRSEAFLDALWEIEARLCEMTGAERAAIFAGSGTMANDAIANQLRGSGMVIGEGEFADRLRDHAGRVGLGLDGHAWIWAVHCETSTGEMADLPALKNMAHEKGAVLCLDCVSSIGAVPVDLTGVAFASFSSGKALASVAGIAGVLINGDVKPGGPRGIDLRRYVDHPIPSTIPSGPVLALREALRRMPVARFEDVEIAGARLRRGLAELGIEPLGTAPHVVTLHAPKGTVAGDIAKRLARHGVLVSAGSDYLVRENRLQIALMGNDLTGLDRLIEALRNEWPR